MKISSLIIAIATITTSCTWVKVTDKGSSVAVANLVNVRNCQNLGETRTSVPNKIGFVNRNADTVATELATLARNDAVDLGGDTIVPSSSVENGKQRFEVYKCNKK